MIAIFGLSTTILVGLALLFLLFVSAALASKTQSGRELQQRALRSAVGWLRHLKALRPSDLRFRGMVSLGLGICSFAALVTLKLFAPVPFWSALTLAALTVGLIILGAAFLERAAELEGER